MEITPKSKIQDILNHFPQLEEEIIRSAPPFENLRNPLLRRTVARLATLEQAARIGGMNPLDLVNRLRRAVGQTEISNPIEMPTATDIPLAGEEDPAWVRGDAQFVVDGNRLLEAGEVPLNHIQPLLGQLEEGRFILLITDFEPRPMIEALQKQNRKVYHKLDEQNTNRHLTYIC